MLHGSVHTFAAPPLQIRPSYAAAVQVHVPTPDPTLPPRTSNRHPNNTVGSTTSPSSSQAISPVSQSKHRANWKAHNTGDSLIQFCTDVSIKTAAPLSSGRFSEHHNSPLDSSAKGKSSASGANPEIEPLVRGIPKDLTAFPSNTRKDNLLEFFDQNVAPLFANSSAASGAYPAAGESCDHLDTVPFYQFARWPHTGNLDVSVSVLNAPELQDRLARPACNTLAPSSSTDHNLPCSSSPAQSGNLSFGMFVNGINPYGNKQGGKHLSIFFIFLVCLTLPITHRFLSQNLYLVGIAPGPKEPSLTQTNWLLELLVEDLKELWSPGLAVPSTHCHPSGRHIHGTLMPFFADLPACRRTLGLAGHLSHAHMCSKCHLPKDEIHTFDLDLLPRRSNQNHQMLAISARDANSYSACQKVFNTHGVLFSKLLELDYWSLINDHVIDPMHNLLLGVLAWHCRRFWKMTDRDKTEAAPPPRKVINLILDRVNTPQRRPPTPQTHESPSQENKGSAHTNADMNILNISFQSTNPGDHDYIPTDDVVDPPMAGAIFDSDFLAYINQRLAQIHIPTSISRMIPILGQASYGSLKADEWRNLFTIQLPLCLVPLWCSKDTFSRALLKKFCHLVSMVNLALKCTMTPNRIAQYRQHNCQNSPDVPLAPNHHMSLHIPECLERFGPVRAWWTVPFQRFMGQVIQSCNNGWIGELETTFLQTFMRATNLRALLEAGNLPPLLSLVVINVIGTDPLVSSTVSTNLTRLSYQSSLSDHVFQLLICQINSLGPPNYISSDRYQQLSLAEQNLYHPIHAPKAPLQCWDYILHLASQPF
ncbi:hypothetical protein PCASD_23021 [Puccinia coronata f. sp. avenae]|uniref:Uncharacterized protein n=1 Tax=Puccinia coronata f. sp. avenae TaxID=200324 RepID=A0A2N5SFU0_9BASI|nr:hypothetical protein PCASD_23021 [Puccinia coronata f. sp. avenae]